MCVTRHLEPLNNLHTGFFSCTRSCYFPSHCSGQRRCERCACFLPGLTVRARARGGVCTRAAHPCLLSSSGSCPVELERGAQLLSASADFILRGGERTQTEISAPKNCAAFRPLGEQNISALAQKHGPNRTQVLFSTKALFYGNISVVFHLYLTTILTWRKEGHETATGILTESEPKQAVGARIPRCLMKEEPAPPPPGRPHRSQCGCSP